jgi:hypothetical protein
MAATDQQEPPSHVSSRQHCSPRMASLGEHAASSSSLPHGARLASKAHMIVCFFLVAVFCLVFHGLSVRRRRQASTRSPPATRPPRSHSEALDEFIAKIGRQIDESKVCTAVPRTHLHVNRFLSRSLTNISILKKNQSCDCAMPHLAHSH